MNLFLFWSYSSKVGVGLIHYSVFFGREGHVALDRNPGTGFDTLLLRMIPGDLLSAFPHRQIEEIFSLNLMMSCEGMKPCCRWYICQMLLRFPSLRYMAVGTGDSGVGGGQEYSMEGGGGTVLPVLALPYSGLKFTLKLCAINDIFNILSIVRQFFM